MNVEQLPVPPLPEGRPRLVLAGFMGSGKTAAGRLAAARLGLPFVDLDGTVARRSGMPIADLWARGGEPAFRAIERQVLAEASRLSGSVIATGGGAVLHDEEFTALTRDAVVVVLTGRPDVLVARSLSDGTARPALGDDPAHMARTLLASRAARYDAAGPALDTSEVPVEDVAAAVASRYGDITGHVCIGAAGGTGATTIVIPTSLEPDAGTEIVAALPSSRAAAVVFDPSVRAVADLVAASAEAAGLRTVLIPLPSGESAKSAGAVAELWSSFHRAGLEPTDVVVAVGGGATLDAGGFAAATYMRGVALVNVPTTLLAMADASFGGKVAVDHAGAKNLAGTFHDPAVVLFDPSVLASLPERAFRAGLAEIVKAALLASPILLDVLEDGATGLHAGAPMLGWILEQAVRIKAAYVAADPQDRGVRHSLNLGHTFAHGIEAASGFHVLHGEAVAMGLVAAARLGEDVEVTPAGRAVRLERVLQALGLPVEPPPGVDGGAVREAMLADKKRRSGGAAFVVPATDGAVLLRDVDLDHAVRQLFRRVAEARR